MHKRRFMLTVALATTILTSVIGFAASAAEVPRMSADELKSHLGSDEVVALDVRTGGDWAGSNMKIAGAERVDPGNVALWANNYDKQKIIVLYCAWSNEYTSARVALSLMELGFSKVYALKGGWREWEASGYPLDPK